MFLLKGEAEVLVLTSTIEEVGEFVSDFNLKR